MAEEHRRAKGALSESPEEEEKRRHSHSHHHHGFHAEKHPDGSYSVHKHHPDGTVTEHGVGGDTEEKNLDKVHDMMHEHFVPAEAEATEGAEPTEEAQAEAPPAGEGEPA